MVYHSENEEDTCHYKLSDRDNFKVSFVGRHFAGFLGKLKETIEKFARRTIIFTPNDVTALRICVLRMTSQTDNSVGLRPRDVSYVIR